jgi:2-succinyl-5-enolpyruvyl-6-hydroxy-3-cyclohexene-1-carboxylate synthase
MPIRDIEWFTPARKGTVIHSNRGANGIDGVVSTAVGVALATGARTTLYIGDVACVHDANGLWNLVERNANLRIVVTNNSGGSIFSFLPQATGVDVEEFEKLFGTPHAVNFADLASAHRIPYQCVTSTKVLHDVLTTTDGPILIEVVTDRDNNVAAHERLNAAIGMAVSKTLQ